MTAKLTRRNVEILESASEQVARDNHKVVEFTDSLERTIKAKKLTVSEKMRLSKAIGDATKNEYYFSMCFLTCSVIEIDGVTVPPATTEREIEILADRLGDEGIDAVAQALAKLAATPQDLVAVAKNS